jgi:N-acetylglucosaminyldiphosphoundecaprenol N-acetyl-beta-D-mannosaminyltransferase
MSDPGLPDRLTGASLAGGGDVATWPPRAEDRRVEVIGVPIHRVSAQQAMGTILGWARAPAGRCVCLCNVHSVVTASREPAFHAVLSQADLALPDGAPVAWMMRRSGVPDQRRVSGPDLMLDLCAEASRTGVPIFLYGSTDSNLRALAQALHARWPALRIAGWHAPPFRAATEQEDQDDVQRIIDSGARLVFVSLGCPKQEAWMAAHQARVPAVMLGVGAAFDFHSGRLRRAPALLRRMGLEWAYRLAQEPRRLGMRYASTNAAFLLKAARQLLPRKERRP